MFLIRALTAAFIALNVCSHVVGRENRIKYWLLQSFNRLDTFIYVIFLQIT